MKAEELFVGALVRVNRDGLCIKKDTIVEVRAVDADDKLMEKGLVGSAHCRPLDDDQFDGGIWCEYLEPIPLTPEILEKNGFEPTPAPSERVWKHNGQEVWLDNEGKNYWANIKNGEFYFEGYIEHTHELQHALRLCGIEKEIKL